MDTAKIFNNGRSQAVRLPKAYRFEGKEVYIKKVGDGVLMIPKEKSVWDVWEKKLAKYDKPFMAERNQPETRQERVGLDDQQFTAKQFHFCAGIGGAGVHGLPCAAHGKP